MISQNPLMSTNPLQRAHVYKNTILRHLPVEVASRLALKAVPLAVGREMEAPGRPIRNLFFLESGLGSMTCMLQDGSQVEVSLFGYESVIGVSAMMGTRYSLNRVYMQLGGHGWMCPVDLAREEFARGADFQRLCLRYVQAQLIQCMQSAACNAKHDLDQRFARWLLLCADRADAETFQISQEFLAQMIGSSRPSVTLAIGRFTENGLLAHQRSQIQIRNRAALEEKSCECYRVVRDHLHNYAQGGNGYGS